MNYRELIAGNRKLLSFGFALAFFSSFGQTFFIALFSKEIRAEFGLTHGSFGALYSLSTLASGFCMIWLGSAIDRIRLRYYTRAVVVGLVLAAALFGAVRGIVMLGIAIFALRLFGQGLMGHTSMTTMARYFHTTRGKAMSIAALGFPLGEAIFPRVFLSVKNAVGWRTTWAIAAVMLAIVLIPFVEWLLRTTRTPAAQGDGDTKGDTAVVAAVNPAGAQVAGPAVTPEGSDRRDRREWTRAEVLRDRRFLLVLPSVLAPPFIGTGIFFHQIFMVESKGWTMGMFASTFAIYAASQLVSSLAAGPFVDRLRASSLLPYYLMPLAAALALLALGSHPAIAFGYMLAAGLSGGAMTTITGAYWAEAYGVRHLGAIRSMVMACMVFSTAAAPVMLGRLIDSGSTIEFIALLCLGYVVVASVLASIGRRRT